MTILQQQIREKLQQALCPEIIEIIDQSVAHSGHHGNSTPHLLQDTHFFVRIVSAAFEGKTLLQQHQMVYKIIHHELTQTTVHALSLDLKIPER